MLIFNAAALMAETSRDSSKKRNVIYPGHFIACGFSDRMASPGNQKFRINYFNEGSFANDTFLFNDKIKSSPQLVNFMLSGGISNRYAGLRLDLGFVPFANRNAQQSLSGFLLIPVADKFLLSPNFGYTRFRKQKKIGTLTGTNGRISFKDEEFDEVVIRVQEVMHSMHFGLGAFIPLDEMYSLYFECRYHRVFRNTRWLKVRAFSDDDNETFLASLSADQYERYLDGNKAVLFRNDANQAVNSFFNIGQLSFSLQLSVNINEAGGSGYSPKKFMGTQ